MPTRVIDAFGRQPAGWIFAEMLVAIALIGCVDYSTGYEIRLLPFYAGPVFVIAWFCGRTGGLVGGFLAGVASLSADWLAHDPDLGGWTEGWEILRHLGSSLAVALVGSALKSRSDIAAARIALLEHSERLEEEIVTISDAEQRRIGQDLHDGLCQYLAGLSCSATMLRDDLQKLNLASEAGAARDLAAMLQDAVVQTRDLARGLVPARVAQVGLALALEALAQSVSRMHGIACTFHPEGALPHCDDHAAVHLYRIAQEAINNAIRHGNARAIAISLRIKREWMELRVSDDGVGLGKNGAAGIGLDIMRYRARLVGGELTIAQPEKGGTVVSCVAKRICPDDEPAPV